MLYEIIEKPLIYVSILMGALVIIYTLLGFTAMQMWGPQTPEFRTLSKAFMSMISIFSLHSNDIMPFMQPLFRFNVWWAFLFMVLYVVFLQQVFMNLFTSRFYEEYRRARMFEEVLATDEAYKEYRQRNTLKLWC